MSDEQLRAGIQELADSMGRITHGYSGRDMYGETCLGVITDMPHQALMMCGEIGLPQPRIDDMGKGKILYWPQAAT